MPSLITLIGRATRDPEMRYTPDGNSTFTKLGFAVDELPKNKKDVTSWWNLTAWDKRAESINTHVHKGDALILEISLDVDQETGSPRIWVGKDGKPHASLEGTIKSWRFCPTNKPKDNSDEGGSETEQEPSGDPTDTGY